MANYTQHYQLHQWEPEDNFLRTDFNEDFKKIDTVLADLAAKIPRYTSGTYVGTGEYGINHPNMLVFEFKPEAVICYNRSSTSVPAVFVRGESECFMDYGNSYARLFLTWTEKSLSWYNTEDEGKQLNGSGGTYRYLALGW